MQLFDTITRNFYLKATTLLFAFLVVPLVCVARPSDRVQVQMLGLEEGLSQSSVLSIHQDSMGFMWFGTRDGINRYDGHSMVTFRHILGDPFSLAGSIINDIKDGGNGTIWIAHDKGISRLDRRSSTFRNYDIGRSDNPEIRSLSIIDDRVWASGWTGMYVYNPEKDLFKKPPLSLSEKMDIFDASISKVVKSATKNEYWIATRTRGLFRYDTDTDILTRKNQNDETGLFIDENERVEDILFHPNGRVYVATYNNGLYECDQSGKPLRRWNTIEDESSTSVFDNIRMMIHDQDGYIWIGGFHGIALLDPSTGELSNIHLQHGAETIEKISIRSLFVDKNNSLWIGTYHDGLLFYDDYLSRFSTHFLPKDNNQNSQNVVSAFAYWNGSLIVATESGNIIEYDANNRVRRVTEVKNRSGDFVVIKSLLHDMSNDVLWVGTLRDGLVKIKEGNIEGMGHEELGMINSLQKAGGDRLWIVSDKGNGINLYNTRERQLESFPISAPLHRLTRNSRGKHLSKLGPDTYLLSTDGAGLILFENRPEGKVTKILPRVTEVNHTVLHNDTIYLSTNGNGIYILDKGLNPLKSFTTDNGLLHNSVFSIIPHGNEKWVTYMNGISQWASNDEFLNYTIINGFPLAEINMGAYARFPEQPLPILVGGKGAWVSLDPRNVYKNPYKPAIFLSGISVNNSPITKMDSYRSFNFRHPSPIRLKHDETTLNFEFSGLSYIMPKNNSFRYQLDDFDSDWNYTSLSGRAGYSKIPSGKYLFRVQASNNDGVWSDELTFPITVLPPWWQTWQAVVFYILSSLTVILFVRRNTLRKAELNHRIQVKELEKQQMEQMHHLKVKYFTDISHEIRTPLMLILHPIEEIIEESTLEKEEKSKMLDIQNQGRNLLRLVNQLLEINSVELRDEFIQEEPIVLKKFIEGIGYSFQSIAAKKGIQWDADLSETSHQTYLLDRDKMEKVLLNLLSNAFKNTPEGGRVSLTIKDLPEGDNMATLQLEVADNGIGIVEEDLPRIFERFFKSGENRVNPGSGIGLSLVKAIVENLMGGQVSVQSQIGEGSRFTVVIPNVKTRDDVQPVEPGEYTIPAEVRSGLEKEEEPILTPERASNKRTVLLVEDNISLLNSLSKRLSQSYNVFGFVSAEQASDFLHTEEVDIVISDIMLPGKSGKVFCAEIKSNIITSHVPVILLTAIQHDDIKMKSLEMGADDYLTKPFSYKELQLRIQNILNRQAQLHDLYKRGTLPEKQTRRINKFDSKLLERIDEHIELNLSNGKYSVEELSSDVSISRVHLYRKMKSMLGVSPSRYIRDYRLKKAADILSREEIRVNDLADKVGFEDPNYFVKCFKEKYGVSPNQYAKM